MRTALPQHITYDKGGTIWIEPIQRVTATVVVLSGDGSTIKASTAATQSGITTTLDGAAAKAAETIDVAAGNGSQFSEGDAFWVRNPDEQHRVKSVSGDTVTLWAPLQHAHASGATVEGTRLSLALSSGDASKRFFDGRAEWTLSDGSLVMSSVVCTDYPIARMVGLQDVRSRFPKIGEWLEREEDPEVLLDTAHWDVLSSIEARDRVHVWVGGIEFSTAVAYQLAVNLHEPDPSDAGERLRETYQARLDREIDKVRANLPRDADQDGVILPSEKRTGGTRRWVRA